MADEFQTDARALIAQHAMTSRLLGVDFLPLGSGSVVERVDEGVEVGVETKRVETNAIESDQGIQAIGQEALRNAYGQIKDSQAQLEALRAVYERQAPHQHFNTTFTNIVFGEGSASAELMFIGEAPGEDEDLSGRPFVGRAGQLLEKMIGAMGFRREDVYICNVLKTRPPNNATPTLSETRLCAPYLFEQIRIVNPRVIVTLGFPASQLLLSSTSTMRSLRGRWHTLEAGIGMVPEGVPKVEIMATYHPAYLLRSYTEENRRKVWSDLVQVIEKLGKSRPGD